MNILERIEDLKSQALKALEGETPDLEKAKALREEAERLKEVHAETERIKGIAIPQGDPVRPPFVGGGEGALPQAAPDSSDAPGMTPLEQAKKAAYTSKFAGEEDAVVKALLTDIHGPDYITMYWAQKAAFNRYMRFGESALTNEDRKALRGFVYTPASIRAALDQGVDDFKTLKSTMVEAVDTLGGYLVPVDFQARVIERLMGYTVMRGAATQITTSRDSVSIPKGTGGDSQYTSAIRVTWVDETPTAGTAESNLTFGMETIPVHTAMIETPLSRNLLEDSAFNLEPFLADKFAEAAGIDEDNQFLTGSGVGRPQGILPNNANGLSLTEANSGNATALTWDGLITLVYSIDSQYRGNARFVAEKATYQAIRKLKDGAGRYLWEPDQQVGQPPRILGYPVYEQENLPTIAAGAYPIIFGDPRGYYIVDRVGMSVERFLDSATARTNTVIFLMRRRLGGQPAETWRFAVQKVSA